MKINVTPAPVIEYDNTKTVRDLFWDFEHVSKHSENPLTDLICAATLYGHNLLEGYMSIKEATGIFQANGKDCSDCPAHEVCPLCKFNL